ILRYKPVRSLIQYSSECDNAGDNTKNYPSPIGFQTAISVVHAHSDGEQSEEGDKDTDAVVTPDRRRNEQREQRTKTPDSPEQYSEEVQDAQFSEQCVIAPSKK